MYDEESQKLAFLRCMGGNKNNTSWLHHHWAEHAKDMSWEEQVFAVHTVWMIGPEQKLTVISHHSYWNHTLSNKTQLWHWTCVLYDPMKQATTPLVACKESNKSSQTNPCTSHHWVEHSSVDDPTAQQLHANDLSPPLALVGCPTKPPRNSGSQKGLWL